MCTVTLKEIFGIKMCMWSRRKLWNSVCLSSIFLIFLNCIWFMGYYFRIHVFLGGIQMCFGGLIAFQNCILNFMYMQCVICFSNVRITILPYQLSKMEPLLQEDAKMKLPLPYNKVQDLGFSQSARLLAFIITLQSQCCRASILGKSSSDVGSDLCPFSSHMKGTSSTPGMRGWEIRVWVLTTAHS